MKKESIKLSLPSFDCWKDIQELCGKMELEEFIKYMQKNYPNGVKIGNIKYELK